MLFLFILFKIIFETYGLPVIVVAAVTEQNSKFIRFILHAEPCLLCLCSLGSSLNISALVCRLNYRQELIMCVRTRMHVLGGFCTL